MSVKWAGSTSQPANTSTPEGPAYVNSAGQYFRPQTGQVKAASTSQPYQPPQQTQSYQNGGWYNGKQYWNGQFGAPGQVIADQGGGAPGGNQPGGGGQPSGGDQGAPPAFNFDYAGAEQEALAKLAPYYQAKLDLFKGDVDKAKQSIEEDYQQGNRFRAENLAAETTQDTQTAHEETMNQLGDLNARGLLFGEIGQPGQAAAPYSQFAQYHFLSPLDQKQQARRQAIERAITQQGEAAGLKRQQGIQSQEAEVPKFAQALEEEKRTKAQSLLQNKYGAQYSQYLTSNPYSLQNKYTTVG